MVEDRYVTSRKQLLLTVGAVMLLAGVLGAAGVPTLGGGDTGESPDAPQFDPTPSPEGSDSETRVTLQSGTNASGVSVTFDNQTSNGTSVTIGSVTLPDGGVVVVQVGDGSGPGAFFGRSPALPPGTSTGVTVPLDVPINGTQTVWAIAESGDEEVPDSAVVNSSRETPFICNYVNPQDRVDIPGLLDGIDDWRNETIGTVQLLDVIDVWRSDDPVSTCY